MEFLTESFKTRQELEEKIQFEVGGNIEKNEEFGHIIKGTAEELKRLHLSDTTKIFGCKCAIIE